MAMTVAMTVAMSRLVANAIDFSEFHSSAFAGENGRIFGWPAGIAADIQTFDQRVVGWTPKMDMRKVEEKYQGFLIQQLRTDKVRHSGRSFYTHLKGTHDLLQSWQNPHAICIAGLFHSIYGTWHFRHRVFPLDRRDVIRDLIGDEAEFLAYVFCVTKRPAEFLANAHAPDIVVKDWTTNSIIRLSRTELNNLLEIEAANLIEQGAKNREILRQLRASEISPAAKRDIDSYLEACVAPG
jgi:hypothetical protein